MTAAEVTLLLASAPDARYLCGGDTAQCITRGVGFRFQQLTSLFYDTEKPLERHTLCVNYRSHAGIQRLCSFIVERLTADDAYVDRCVACPEATRRGLSERTPPCRLPSEQPYFNGPLVELVLTDSVGTLSDALFTDGQLFQAGGSFATELGAHQCCIVRNEAAKRNLPVEFSDSLVFTVEESKVGSPKP
jgi:hypothetical protein